jgi:hypothetical protein
MLHRIVNAASDHTLTDGEELKIKKLEASKLNQTKLSWVKKRRYQNRETMALPVKPDDANHDQTWSLSLNLSSNAA